MDRFHDYSIIKLCCRTHATETDGQMVGSRAAWAQWPNQVDHLGMASHLNIDGGDSSHRDLACLDVASISDRPRPDNLAVTLGLSPTSRPVSETSETHTYAFPHRHGSCDNTPRWAEQAAGTYSVRDQKLAKC